MRSGRYSENDASSIHEEAAESGRLQDVRILAFAPRLWPVWGAGTQRTTAFVSGFLRSGAHVTAITLDAKERHAGRATVEDLHIAANHLGDLPWQIGHIAMCLGLSDPAAFALARARRAKCKSSSFDLVFASGAPFSAVTNAERCARRHGIPLVCDMRDEWSANPFLRTGPWHAFLEKRRERSALADTIAVSAPYSEVLDSLAVDSGAMKVVIPHGCDRALVDELVADPGPPLENTEPLVLLFAGARYGRINEKRFLETVAGITDAPNIRLRLVGSERPVHAPKLRTVSVDVVGPVAHRRLMEEYSKSHALLLLGPAERGKGWIPSKLEEYKATGRPIISFGARGGRLESLIRSLPGGFAAPEGDSEALRRALSSAREAALERSSFRRERTLRSWTEVGTEASSLVARALERSR